MSPIPATASLFPFNDPQGPQATLDIKGGTRTEASGFRPRRVGEHGTGSKQVYSAPRGCRTEGRDSAPEITCSDPAQTQALALGAPPFLVWGRIGIGSQSYSLFFSKSQFCPWKNGDSSRRTSQSLYKAKCRALVSQGVLQLSPAAVVRCADPRWGPHLREHAVLNHAGFQKMELQGKPRTSPPILEATPHVDEVRG